MLSIIIVNYNVKYFLEQCLYSVEKALTRVDAPAEVLVVDNDSKDGSLEYLVPRFPRVIFIRNAENSGFSKANNLAMKKAEGDYILFLNPDTIIAEDSLAISLDFMKERPSAGAAGFCMIDGSGFFLKESRRGFPGPWASFCRLSGLGALFPRSSFFAGYYLGGTDAGKNGPAPILSGACMMVKKEALLAAGNFDERFFMYAEDIDLSHRITLAGFTNYYIAGTAIIHFKGESTRRDKRYVKQFHIAMSQFMRKYYKGSGTGFFIFLMDTAIWCRAVLSAIARLLSRAGKKRGGSRPGQPEIFIKGDPASAALLKKRLPGIRPLEGPLSGKEQVIFCEGPDFPFKKIIEALRATPGLKGFIHASGSDSIVGSPLKDEAGEIFILPCPSRQP